MNRSISKKITSLFVCFFIILSSFTFIDNIFYTPCRVKAEDEWSNGIQLSYSSGSTNTPKVATWDNNIHVVWADSRHGHYEIYYKRSTDNGVSWGPEMRLTSTSSNQERPRIDVSGNNVHVLWNKGYRKSIDNGDTWNSIVNIFNDLYETICFDLAVVDNTVYVAAAERNYFPPGPPEPPDESYDAIKFRKSSTNGDSWNSWLILDGPTIDEAMEIALAASGGSVHIVYGYSPFGHDAFIRWFNHSYSDSGGSSWYWSYLIDTGGMQKKGLSMSYCADAASMVWCEVADHKIMESKTHSIGWGAKNEIGYGYFMTSVSENYIVWNNEWPGAEPLSIYSNFDDLINITEGYDENREYFDVKKESDDIHFVLIYNYQVFYIQKVPRPNLFAFSNEIKISPPSPIENGTLIYLSAKIHNTGQSAQNVEIRFYNGNPDDNGDLIQDVDADVIGNDTIDINTEGYNIASIQWIPPSRGVYNIYIWIDPDNLTNDYNYNDNLVLASESLIICDWVDRFDNQDRIFSSENVIFHNGDIHLRIDENATEWEYEYNANVEPEIYGWELKENAAADLANASGGILYLNTSSENAYWWYNYNWNASNSIGVTLEANFKVEDIGPNSDLFLFVRDGTRFDGINIFENRIQCLNDPSLFYYIDTTDQFHIYRITAKNDDIMVYVDGLLCINGTNRYTSSTSGNIAQFGETSDSAGYYSNSHWDYVKFNTTGTLEPNLLTEGAVTSVDIILPFGNNWDELVIDKTELPETYINVTVFDGLNGKPIPGYIDLDENIIDLSSIDLIKYPILKLVGNFIGTQEKSPILHHWTINFTYSSSGLLFKEGWNLVSLPTVQSDTTLQAVLQSIEGDYNAVQWYDALDTNDPWKHYQTIKPSHMNDLKNLNHTIGFWIHINVSGGTLLPTIGESPTATNISLNQGWNLVGYPSFSNKNIATALNNLIFNTDVDAIMTYNAASQRWERIGESGYFLVGRGYYIHAKTDCVWEVPL